MRIAFQLPVVLLAAMLPACAYSRPDWREEKFEGMRFEQVWTALEESVRACGYAPDEAATDRGEKKLVTRWRTREMPFSKGERTRVVAEVLMPPDPSQVVELRFQVERQVNKNMATSFNPEEKDWTPSGQEGAMEARLLKHLKLRTLPLQPGAAGTSRAPEGANDRTR